jgi:hypothetical protein
VPTAFLLLLRQGKDGFAAAIAPIVTKILCGEAQRSRKKIAVKSGK